MKKLFKRLISLIFAVLAFASIPFGAFASYSPGVDDLRGCNYRIEFPSRYCWLDSYETKYVKTKYGVCAYLRYEPKSDSDYYDYVYERDAVTVLARENGYSLVKRMDGVAGWVTSSVLVDSYPSGGNSGGSNAGRQSYSRSVTEPEWYNRLESYEYRYVKTKYGVCAYLRYEPKSDSDYFGYVYEKDLVTVIARQNGYSLVISATGQTGWVTSSALVSRY
ncbi:MAG: hypothetical protein K6C12_04555 [Oscillospiraceae bacterium]|nr:hypothetical protein [Oscillospiraceae bacterium]